MPERFLLAGVLGIFCGESFCILGPLRYERRIHVACHSILYSGTLLPSSALIGPHRPHRRPLVFVWKTR
jgi:hypothetical protein